jgi:hypothetical protein
MYRGSVDFIAPVTDGGITFSSFDLSPPLRHCSKASLACVDGLSITGTVWIEGVHARDECLRTAHALVETLLSRLSFAHELPIGLSRITASQFEPETPQPGHTLFVGTGHYYLTGHAPKIVRSLDTRPLQQALEQALPRGEVNYGEFRSARISTGPVEEFMHLYGILLSQFGDKQSDVDQFIVQIEPSVPQSPSPWKMGATETLYTKLRNQLAHKRADATLEAIRHEIAAHVGMLRRIVREAISR